MSHRSRVVVSVRNELHGPLLVMLGFWILAAAVTSVFARTSWLWFAALGAVVGASGMMLFIARPRRGELLRLVLDGERRIVYWAHRGEDPDELPFSALAAIVIEPQRKGRMLKLHAVEQSGRWVTLGSGPRAHLAPFAREVATRVGVPLWSRDRSGAVEDLTDLVLLPEDEYRAGS
jgi:hypothetical protein